MRYFDEHDGKIVERKILIKMLELSFFQFV